MHKVTVRDLNFFSIRKIHQSFPISKPRPHTSLLIHISRKNCKYFKILCVLWHLAACSMNLQIFLILLGYIYQSKYAKFEHQLFSFGNLPGNLLLHFIFQSKNHLTTRGQYLLLFPPDYVSRILSIRITGIPQLPRFLITRFHFARIFESEFLYYKIKKIFNIFFQLYYDSRSANFT